MKKILQFLRAKKQKFSEYIGKNRKLFVIGSAVIVVILIGVWYFFSEREFEKSEGSDINAAYSLSASGKKTEAITLLEKRYNHDKGDTEVAKILSTLYFQNKDYGKFIDLVESAKFNDSETYTMLAYVSRMNGDQEKTLEYYKKAIELSPRSVNVYENLANYYQILGETDKALEIVKNGMSVNSKSPTLNLMAANLALALGDKDLAKQYAQKVLEYDEENASAKAILSNK